MDQEGVPGKQKIIILMFVLYVVWGSVFLANRFSLESFPPFMLNAVRFLSAGIFLYVLLRVKGEEGLDLRGWLESFVVGAMLFIGGAGLLCVGQQWVASGLSATLLATTPLWTVLFAGIWEKMPTTTEWAGLGIGIAGVALLNLDRGISGNPLGAGIILVASIIWSLGSVLNNRFQGLGKPIASATEMIAGGLLLLILSLLVGERISWPLTARATMGMFHLVVFSSIIGFTLYRFMLRTVRPALATSYTLVNPITATVLGALFAGESVSLVSIAAMAVVLTGVFLVFRARAI
ncbi:MAG: EamA family transporter [Thermovirgaceae bacterium]|nr:EamA family transporter [Synergistales bacterium]MDI9391710.1 EamA family transporter [Synergistota bacterium]MDY0178620.1 EamA family transporter [Synergistaceae bacterium]HRW86957.1 EamA family transporter [Thermovirgaceae bacterium]MDD3133156.1 EamA family transporter [Synergistales bacterium]